MTRNSKRAARSTHLHESTELGEDRARRAGAHDADVLIESEGIDVAGRPYSDPGVERAQSRFGGLDVPASLVGMLTALAFLVIIGGLVGAAIGAIGYQTGIDGVEQELSIGGLVGGLVALALAYLLGGWAAGRMARYDGALNGAMTAVWTILLAAVLGGLAAWLGSEYDVLANVDLPQWFSTDAATIGAIVSGIVAVAVMLIAGALGGRWGERYHQRADATIAGTRFGGLDPRRDTVVRP